MDPEKRERAVAWEDFCPGAPVPVTPGSDGFVGMVLRDFASATDRRGRRNGNLLDPTSAIKDLRMHRCRSIVILTDFVGSGNQAGILAKAIERNPTIRSWRSFGWLSIHVATVGAQASGVKALQKSRVIDGVHVAQPAPTLHTEILDTKARDRVAELCRSYCRVRQSQALGYKESGGLFVTERSVPNNTPAIFWQTGPNWVPLFGNRVVGDDFVEQLGEYRKPVALHALATRVRQERLGRNERAALLRPPTQDIVRTLIALSRKQKSAMELGAEAGFDVAHAERLLATLQLWGLLDGAGAITQRGRRELHEYRRGKRHTTADLKGSEAPYYPLSLRWGDQAET